jgi:DNA replication protein DnaC
MRHQSIDKLRALRLTGMARALEEQVAQADIGRLSFDERLAILIDREEVDRHNAALAQRLRLARLRQAVCLEDIDYSTPRGLDRTLIRSLAAGRWLAERNNVLVLGPTGAGKSFVACALGNQAAREGHSVRYQRLSRLLDELAIGRAEGRYARLLTRLSKINLLIIDDWLVFRPFNCGIVSSRILNPYCGCDGGDVGNAQRCPSSAEGQASFPRSRRSA